MLLPDKETSIWIDGAGQQKVLNNFLADGIFILVSMHMLLTRDI